MAQQLSAEQQAMINLQNEMEPEISTIWALCDFTEEIGATRKLSGSYLLHALPSGDMTALTLCFHAVHCRNRPWLTSLAKVARANNGGIFSCRDAEGLVHHLCVSVALLLLCALCSVRLRGFIGFHF